MATRRAALPRRVNRTYGYRAPLFAPRISSEAIDRVVIHDPRRLHPGVDNHRAHKFESAFLQRRRDRFRQWRLRGDFAGLIDDRFPPGHVPGEIREILAAGLHRQIGASAADRRFNLARERTIPGFCSRRFTSRGPNLATTFGSNPSNASRNASRFLRIVIHESPA